MLADPWISSQDRSPSWLRPAEVHADARGLSLVPGRPFQTGVVDSSCDAMSQGWAGKCQVSPSKQAGDEEKKRHVKTCQKWAAPRAGEVLDFGLSLWQRRRQSAHAEMRLPVEPAALSSSTVALACMARHAVVCLCRPGGQSSASTRPEVAWSQHDWAGLKDWATASGC